jgi:hypothetical protein
MPLFGQIARLSGPIWYSDCCRDRAADSVPIGWLVATVHTAQPGPTKVQLELRPNWYSEFELEYDKG